MYSIQDVSKKTGLSTHTLRYYEKEGLLTGVARSAGGIRQYSDEDIERLGLIGCLKNTGMPLKEIARFIALTDEGDQTLPQRVEMLKAHRQTVVERMAQMQRHLDKVTCKIDYFSGLLRSYEEAGAGNKSTY